MRQAILDAIRLWNQGKGKYLLSKATHFYLQLHQPIFPKGKPIHVYPGIFIDDTGEETLKFIVLSEIYDNNKWLQNVQVVDVFTDLETNPIHDRYPIPSSIVQEIKTDEALQRIENWKMKKDSWIQNSNFIYAFYIPTLGLNNMATYQTIFALKDGEIDLVMTSNSETYYSHIRLIKQHTTPNFFLLNL